MLGAHAASAALGAPSATTGVAQGVTASSATLTGSVNPQGQSTTYHFEYGTTTSYGSSTPSAGAGSGLSAMSVSAAISGLSPHTTYHYRLVATNLLGTTNGGDKTFTTTTALPIVTTGAASSVATTSATLTGSIDPQGQSTTYHFEYGRTTAYGSQTADTGAGSGTAGVDVSAPIAGLSPNTSYHFRIVAKNAIGTRSGADKTFTTAAVHPPAVSTGAATAVTTTTATLKGTVNPQGQSTTYYFQYGTSTSYGSQSASGGVGGASAQTGISSVVGGLSPTTIYHYRLVATNATATSFGADRTFTTARVPPTRPPAAVTGDAEGITPASATITGTANPEGTTSSYHFQYGPTAAYGEVTPTVSAGSGGNDVTASAALTGLASGTTYHYRLVATNAGGTSYGADRTFATFPPLGFLLNASRATLIAGQGTTLRGFLLGPGSLVTTVTLQQATRASGPFVDVRTTTSADDGSFTFSGLRPARTMWFRTVGADGVSDALRVVVGFRVTLLAGPVHRRGRQLVRLHGVVAPSHNGRKVLLQKLGPRHRWQTISRPRLHRGHGNLSAYSVTIGGGLHGLWRALVPPDAGHARGLSRSLRIRSASS